MVSKSEQTSHLVIIEGEDKGRIIPLMGGSLVIGRSKGDVLVQDPRVSRCHAVLHYDPQTHCLTFTDLKSLNGVFVNGRKLETGELKDGDKLQLGNTLFDCQLIVDSHDATMISEVASLQPLGVKAPEEPAKIADTGAPLALEMAEPESSYEKRVEPKRMAAPAPGAPPKKRRSLGPPQRTHLMLGTALVLLALLYFALPLNNDLDKKTLQQTLANINQLADEGKWEEAIALAEQAKQDFPESGEVSFLLGNLYADRNKNDAALANYRQAHTITPVNPVLHIKLIRVLLRSGLAREAGEELQHVEQAIREGKHSKELFVEAAHLFLEFKELKQPPEKALVLAQALQKEYAPGSTVGYKLEAQAYLQSNRPREAIGALEKARQLDAKDEWILENLVLARLTIKDMTETERTLNDWLELTPDSTKALLIFAYLRSSEGNYNKAVPYLQKILEIGVKQPKDPFYPEALNLTGQIYQQLGQPQEAMSFYQQACQQGFKQACGTQASRGTTATAATSPAPSPAAAPVAPAPSPSVPVAPIAPAPLPSASSAPNPSAAPTSAVPAPNQSKPVNAQ